MKAIRKLQQSLNGNAPKPAHKRSKIWKSQHPVSAGIIEMVDYIPPKGNYIPVSRSNGVTHDDCQFVLSAIRVLERGE